MAESIRDKVAIIGMGLSKWGELWNYDIFDLITEAGTEDGSDGMHPLLDLFAEESGYLTGISPEACYAEEYDEWSKSRG